MADRTHKKNATHKPPDNWLDKHDLGWISSTLARRFTAPPRHTERFWAFVAGPRSRVPLVTADDQREHCLIYLRVGIWSPFHRRGTSPKVTEDAARGKVDERSRSSMPPRPVESVSLRCSSVYGAKIYRREMTQAIHRMHTGVELPQTSGATAHDCSLACRLEGARSL